MSVLDLYAKSKDKQNVAPNMTYQDYIQKMQVNGTNDLVERDLKDPTFRPPLPQNAYLAAMFKDTVESPNS